MNTTYLCSFMKKSLPNPQQATEHMAIPVTKELSEKKKRIARVARAMHICTLVLVFHEIRIFSFFDSLLSISKISTIFLVRILHEFSIDLFQNLL